MEGFKPDSQSRKFYNKYSKLVSFKSRFFAKQIRDEDNTILELLSGPGDNIDSISRYIDLSKKEVICLDLDKEALLACKQKGYHVLYKDVNNMELKKESIDLFISNSLHHIPTTVENVLKEQIIPALKDGGRMIGVEGNGPLALFIINCISLLPKFIINRSIILREFYNERNEIRNFLKLNFSNVLSQLNLKKLTVKKSFLYLFYVMEK